MILGPQPRRLQPSFVPNDTATTDKYGHGEMVAGLLGGNGNQSTTSTATYVIRGIAPNVNIVNLRVLDSNGSSTDSIVIAAVQEAINLKAKYNIRVINLSLGRPVSVSYAQDPLCQAVRQASDADCSSWLLQGTMGATTAIATGSATINAPGNTPAAITVGAMNTLDTLSPSDDKMTSYSSKGPTLLDHIVKPDMVAPGNRIYSLQAANSTLVETHSNNRVAWSSYDSSKASSPSPVYFELSGTSLAAPIVSGYGGAADPAESQAHAGSSQGAADEDRHEASTNHHLRDRSQHRNHVCDRKRRLYGGRGLSECPGGAQQY